MTPSLSEHLSEILKSFSAMSGTIHRADPGSGTLHLVSAEGIPATVRPHIEVVPIGKGMAGLCAERNDVVHICNLQTDSSGQARPRAQQTGVEGAIVVPIRDREGKVAGTLGIGKPGAYDYPEKEIRALLKQAAGLARMLH